MMASAIAGTAATALFGAALWWIAIGCAERRGLSVATPPLAFVIPIAAVFVLTPGDLVAGLTLTALCIGGFCDARCGYIFDPVVAGGLTAVVLARLGTNGILESLVGSLGVAGGLLGLWTVTRGRGIGLGDVKLATVLGAGLGAGAGYWALGAAFVLGAISAAGYLASGKMRPGSTIRFGPYLAAGTLLVLAYHRLSTGVTR